MTMMIMGMMMMYLTVYHSRFIYFLYFLLYSSAREERQRDWKKKNNTKEFFTQFFGWHSTIGIRGGRWRSSWHDFFFSSSSLRILRLLLLLIEWHYIIQWSDYPAPVRDLLLLLPFFLIFSDLNSFIYTFILIIIFAFLFDSWWSTFRRWEGEGRGWNEAWSWIHSQMTWEKWMNDDIIIILCWVSWSSVALAAVIKRWWWWWWRRLNYGHWWSWMWCLCQII